MNNQFRATQDGDTLYLEGTYSTSYPGYRYKVAGITLNDDNTLEVHIDVYDNNPGAIRPCVVGSVEVYEEIDLSALDGFDGQELHTLHLVSTGAFEPDVDLDIDQA